MKYISFLVTELRPRLPSFSRCATRNVCNQTAPAFPRIKVLFLAEVVHDCSKAAPTFSFKKPTSADEGSRARSMKTINTYRINLKLRIQWSKEEELQHFWKGTIKLRIIDLPVVKSENTLAPFCLSTDLSLCLSGTGCKSSFCILQ